MKSVILYDFDKTIIDTESIILLWRYAYSKYPRRSSISILKLIDGQLRYRRTRDFKHMKNAMMSILNFLTEKDLKYFVHNILYPKHFYKNVFDEFKKYDDSQIKILSSASCTNYVKYVGDILSFDYIIGTELDENFKVKYENNKREQKVRNIYQLLNNLGEEIDYENSFAYSDSYKDDKFMLELVKNKYLINSKVKVSGYKNLNWIV